MNQLTSFQFEPLCPHNEKTHLHKINRLSEEETSNPTTQPQFKSAGLILKSSFHNPRTEYTHEPSCLFLKSEFMVLKKLRHPNIVRVFEYYDTFQVLNPYKQCCMVLEKAEMDLFQYMQGKEAKLSLIKNIFREIALGLQYIHEQGYAHNDIKCSNVLVFKSEQNRLEIKIADFEMAREKNFFSNGQEQRECWENRNLEYASPELAQLYRCRQSNIEMVDEQKADVFAFGIILFKIIFGQVPFTKEQRDGASKNDQMYRFMVKKQYNRFWSRAFIDKKIRKYEDQEMDANFELVKDLINNLLSYDPRERYNMEQVLSHPWFCL